MEEFILNMDREMSKKSFEYFFTEMLEFLYNDHHASWHDGLANHQYYCVKASRDHGKSVFFMSYALWLAAFKPNTHIMIFSHSLEQTLEHMRFIRNLVEGTPILRHLKDDSDRWAKSYFNFTNGSRLMAKSVGGATRGFHPDIVVCDDILWGTTSTELAKTADWFYGVLLPVLHHSSKLMMVGTPFSYNDLYAELEQKETFRVETYPAIDADGVALWPERWNKEATMNIEAGPRRPHPRMPENTSIFTAGQAKNLTSDADPDTESEGEDRGDELEAAPRPVAGRRVRLLGL